MRLIKIIIRRGQFGVILPFELFVIYDPFPNLLWTLFLGRGLIMSPTMKLCSNKVKYWLTSIDRVGNKVY